MRMYRKTLQVQVILVPAVGKKTPYDSLDKPSSRFYKYLVAGILNVTVGNVNVTGETEYNKTVSVMPTLAKFSLTTV